MAVAGNAGSVVGTTEKTVASPDLLMLGGETTRTPFVFSKRVLQLDEARIRSALVPAGLGQLLRQLVLELVGLLLLLFGLLLLLLELDLLRLQVRRLGLRVRSGDLDIRRLLGQGDVLLVDRVRLLAQLLGLIRERDRRLRQLLLLLGESCD